MSDDDKHPPREKSFRELIGKVRPLVVDTIEPERPRPPPRRRRVEYEAASLPLEPAAYQRLGSDSHDAAAGQDYHRPGLQNSVLRKLRRGQFPVQDELDLHGMTVVPENLGNESPEMLNNHPVRGVDDLVAGG